MTHDPQHAQDQLVVRWREPSESPKIRQRCLLLNGQSISLGTWVRTPFKPHEYAFRCERGWFRATYFKAWMPVSELIPQARTGGGG